MEYLIDPFSPDLAEPPEDDKMEPSKPPAVGAASSWPQYYPLYGVYLPFDDEK